MTMALALYLLTAALVALIMYVGATHEKPRRFAKSVLMLSAIVTGIIWLPLIVLSLAGYDGNKSRRLH